MECCESSIEAIDLQAEDLSTRIQRQWFRKFVILDENKINEIKPVG